MWPKERTAILVIHGVGQQSPFDTLDGFVRGLWDTLQQQNQGSVIKARHEVRDLDGWTKNCISLIKDGAENPPIDCFEYYWAHQTERRTDAGEVFDWLVKTGAAAQKHYDEMAELAAAYEAQGADPFGKQYVLFGKPRFKKYGYLKHAGTALRVAQVLVSVIGPVASRYPGAGKPIQFALRVVGSVFKPFIVGYLGDIVIYTTTDLKSKHFEVRTRILDGATKEVEWLLRSQKPEYGRVILAGHSLGSVIAYDTLNRINNGMNAGRIPARLNKKLTGLATFGSPLDKVFFFFQERAPDKHFVKKQILAQHHAFKAKNPTPGKTLPKTVEDGIQPLLDHIRWINFWDSKDPISGPLDFYDIASGDNRDLQLNMRWGVAHGGYWEHGPMYEQIVKDLF